MGFVMDGLDAEAYDRSYSDRTLIGRIGSYFAPHTRTVAIVVVMVVLASVASTVTPLVIARGVESLAGKPSQAALLGLAGIVLTMGGLAWVFNYARQLLAARVVGDVVLKIREDAFSAVASRDMSFFDQFASGKIVSRITSDTQDFATVVTLTIDLFSQLLLVVAIGVIMFFYNVQLALIVLALAPIVVVIALTFRSIARSTTRQAQRAQAEVNASIQETISGIAVAKSFRQEGAIYGQFRATNSQAFGVRLRQGLVFGSIFPVLNTFSGIGVAVIIYFGGLAVLQGRVSTGDWYLFVQSLAIFFFPLTSIASFWSQFQQGLSAAERVFALIDTEPKVIQRGDVHVGALRGEIDFSHVDFSYGGDAEHTAPSYVLRDFSLHIPAGEKLAVVGHPGAGKSSLIKLITRFYEFQSGAIAIDGVDIRELNLADYRRRIGLVPQVPFLFSGTVAQNISYGRQDASDADVLEAAQHLDGGAWIGDLPEGLNTDVGERGARLSLGQRQLVALARVLLQNPSVFILDEATASIDPFTEEQIQTGLDAVMAGRTSIIIAHRLSTVRAADRIIVLKQGQIIEQGTHDALIAQGGHYAELYNTYFRHQRLDYKPWEEPVVSS